MLPARLRPRAHGMINEGTPRPALSAHGAAEGGHGEHLLCRPGQADLVYQALMRESKRRGSQRQQGGGWPRVGNVGQLPVVAARLLHRLLRELLHVRLGECRAPREHRLGERQPHLRVALAQLAKVLGEVGQRTIGRLEQRLQWRELARVGLLAQLGERRLHEREQHLQHLLPALRGRAFGALVHQQVGLSRQQRLDRVRHQHLQHPALKLAHKLCIHVRAHPPQHARHAAEGHSERRLVERQQLLKRQRGARRRLRAAVEQVGAEHADGVHAHVGEGALGVLQRLRRGVLARRQPLRRRERLVALGAPPRAAVVVVWLLVVVVVFRHRLIVVVVATIAAAAGADAAGPSRRPPRSLLDLPDGLGNLLVHLIRRWLLWRVLLEELLDIVRGQRALEDPHIRQRADGANAFGLVADEANGVA
mmetsp:Transcript_52133/g.153862  ORF Transcript_52133/g.153862 Transcript_52133/m.153862 type:complete len:421 (-) Transcript_52133:750-2012(-)